MSAIYADHAATTPLRPEVAEVMIESMQEPAGNPSSVHQYGRRARKRLDAARRMLASSISASPKEIIWTSGGTESNNLALRGFMHANREKGSHLVTSAIEHHAVLHTAQALEKEGFQVTYVEPDEQGIVSVEKLMAAVTDETILVSLMYVNNETGVVQPVLEAAETLAEKGIAFHTDMVQAYGQLPFSVAETPVTMATMTAHKINGPAGAGCLFVRKGAKLRPELTGGEQERRRRAGTENVAAIDGFAKAVELQMNSMPERRQELEVLGKAFLSELGRSGAAYRINGEYAEKSPHILNIYFPGIQLEAFLVQMDMEGVAVSSGSACTAGTVEPSHVLEAMYGKDARIYESVRFSFGYKNTVEDMKTVARAAAKISRKMKEKEALK
ncbi:cysteine desulfurase [Marinococcus halophilus]|uniref:Cysteine desulfurase n=1 Tax=Marinococcus halophilus TaxID=1371 RepID=A0A510Y623_MARHA|nr:cysteine desulfurase family protein [Marinococcus halophilus]OZT81088.1 cysteine desulfurase [Marinococcus halophilus]GEK58802.1 cysteine desulfurase [Marinococcus halophilus]